MIKKYLEVIKNGFFKLPKSLPFWQHKLYLNSYISVIEVNQ